MLDRAVLVGLAVVSALVAIAVVVVTVDIWVESWPSFGMTLVAVPAALVAAAFGLVSFTAVKVAFNMA